MSRIVTQTGTFKGVPNGYSSTNSSYSSVSSSYPISNGYDGSSTTNYAYITCRTGSNASSYISYTFDTSEIPSNATITSVTCLVKSRVSSTNYIATAVEQLYANTTAKGSSTSFRSTTASARTVNGGSSWTRSEIENIQIRCTAKRGTSNTSRAAYIYFYGADLTIEYSWNETLYAVTINNTAQGVTVTPSNSAEVEQGGELDIRISGDISNGTVTDNGVDVTSQLVQKQYSNPSYTVATAPGASYGFNLSSGWYESTNKGVSSSTALARVTFESPVLCNITFTYINYAEATYDFGVFSKLDTALSTTPWTSTSSGGDTTTDAGLEERRLNTSSYNTSSQQTLTYSNVSAGEHFIDVKFSKDEATNSNNDSLRFQVTITPLETIPTGYYYEYTLSNVQADHTIAITTAAPVAVTGVTLNQNSASITEEGTVQLTATVSPNDASNKNVTWSSSNTSVATVSNGLVTAVSPGTATITVTTVDGNYTATCTVTVTALPRTEYEIATTMEPGKSYIVASGNSGSIYMMSNISGGSRILTGVPITVTNGKISLTATQEAKCLFNCIEYTSGNNVTTTLESNGSYLYCDNSSGLRFQTSSSLDRFWHYNSNKFWQFKNSTADGYDDTSSEYKYYLQINNGNFTDNHVSTTSIEDSNIPAIYLFTLASSDKLFIKKSGSWVQVNKIYQKVNGSWTEVTLNTLSTPQLYVKG